MTAMPLPSITLTSLDFQRLLSVVAQAPDRDRVQAEALENEIERATVVPSESIAPSVVTMNSCVLVQDESSHDGREITLVYPNEADVSAGRVSILSPLGCALIGLSTGQSIAWDLPKGRRMRLRVVEVRYQPEANGRFDL